MSRLTNLMEEKPYEFECLMAYKQIIESGSCNDCKLSDCQYRPKLGELVRYNCPFYVKE